MIRKQDRFTTTLSERRVKVYQFTQEQYINHYRDFVRTENIMCQTFLDSEVTLYKYVGEDDDRFLEICSISDPREYHILNIHEDLPGIDHIGIVSCISSLFSMNHIPLMYINTFSYNLILISEEYIEKALEVIKEISNLDYE
jgi:hypothetical protein